MSSCEDSGENDCTENGDFHSSDTSSSIGEDNGLKLSVPLRPLSILRNSGEKLNELTDKTVTEHQSLKRSESDAAFLFNFVSKSPRKLRKSLASILPKIINKPKSPLNDKSCDIPRDQNNSLKRVESELVFRSDSLSISPKKLGKSFTSISPKATSKPKRRRVTVNEYPQYLRFSSAPHSPVDSRTLDASFRKNSTDLTNSDSVSRSRSLEGHYRNRKLELSPSMGGHDKKQEKKRLRSISLLSRTPLSIAHTDHDSQDEAESRSPGRKIFKLFSSNVQRKKATNSEELTIKPATDPSTIHQNNLDAGGLGKSGLSLPDESILRDSSPVFENARNSLQNTDAEYAKRFLEEHRGLEQLKQKVIKATEMISKERIEHEENIAEYVKLIANADKQQAVRIKAVFDKKNKKSTATIDKLQRKLESYQRRIKDIETTYEKNAGLVEQSAVESEQDSPVASLAIVRPADMTIEQLPRGLNEIEKQIPSTRVEPRSDESFEWSTINFENSLEEWSRHFQQMNDVSRQNSLEAFPVSQSLSRNVSNASRHLHAISSYLLTIRNELENIREAQNHIEKRYENQIDEMESTLLRQLDEDSLRREEQLNELADSQHRDIRVLKQELRSLEEKMEYHAHEQARDTQELLESCQNRIAKIELQQHQQTDTQQDTAHVRAVVGKLMNLLLAVLALVFVVLSTFSGLVRPFLKSWVHLTATALVLLLGFTLYNNWDEMWKYFGR